MRCFFVGSMVVFALLFTWYLEGEAMPLLSGDGTETCSLGPLLGGGGALFT